ncbi:hypothetical protein Nmel_005560 [Mimus melanotis]
MSGFGSTTRKSGVAPPPPRKPWQGVRSGDETQGQGHVILVAEGTLCPLEQGPPGPEPVGALLPDVWARLLQQNLHLLGPGQPWLHQRLEQIYLGRWWLVEATESCILRYLCICGLDAEALAQGLLIFLEGLVHGLMDAVAAQCSKKAQRLLHSHTARDEDSSQADSTSSSGSKSSSFSSSRSEESTPTSSSNVEEEAGTSEVTHHGVSSHCRPVPDPEEWDQPQKQSEQLEQPAVAGPSALSQGRGCLSGVTPCAQKRKAPGLWILPSPARGHDGNDLTPAALWEPRPHFRLN